MRDQFIAQQPPGNPDPKRLDLKKPTALCVPARKDVGGGEVTEIKNPAVHLVCYQAKPSQGEPKHQAAEGICVNDQFGPERLDTVQELEFCVPSEKI